MGGGGAGEGEEGERRESLPSSIFDMWCCSSPVFDLGLSLL